MKTLTLREIEEGLIARKRELGLTGRDLLPRNDGARRTASKRALLQAIEDNARAQGREPRFKGVIGRD
jgi:hypothetical protein